MLSLPSTWATPPRELVVLCLLDLDACTSAVVLIEHDAGVSYLITSPLCCGADDGDANVVTVMAMAMMMMMMMVVTALLATVDGEEAMAMQVPTLQVVAV